METTLRFFAKKHLKLFSLKTQQTFLTTLNEIIGVAEWMLLSGMGLISSARISRRGHNFISLCEEVRRWPELKKWILIISEEWRDFFLSSTPEGIS